MLFPLARALMDYGRFPQEVNAYHPDQGLNQFFARTALVSPTVDALTLEQKESVLSDFYDRVSAELEAILPNKLIKLAIHTYDPRNACGTARSPVSLLMVPEHYQHFSCLPDGAFDPLFPHTLGEFTANRLLVYRIAFTLENAGIPVSLNLPYTLPTGSVEVRAQVWLFIQWLRAQFEAEYPETQHQVNFQQVWKYLANTNARRPETRAWRHSLAQLNLETIYSTYYQAYEQIQQYLHQPKHDLVNSYKFSTQRPSCIAIEIRKDFLFDCHKDYQKRALHENRLQTLIQALTDSIHTYLTVDYPYNHPIYA